MTGIEPAFSAWEADVLPLNYTRKGSHPTALSFVPPPAPSLTGRAGDPTFKVLTTQDGCRPSGGGHGAA